MVATRRRVVRGPFAPRLVTRWLLLLVLVIVVLVTLWGRSPLHPLLEQPLHKHASPRVILQSPAQVSDALLASLDAVLVLGGGRPTTLAEPPLYVQRRCDDAATLAQRYAALDNAKTTMTIRMSDKHPLDLRPAVLPILTLSAGTAHVPQLLAPDGLPIWESTASAAYLAQRYPHIQPQQLYVETVSYDTIGNAFFARTTHTDVNGWHKLLVITNDFHMNRTAAILILQIARRRKPTSLSTWHRPMWVSPTTRYWQDTHGKKPVWPMSIATPPHIGRAWRRYTTF
jgi:uncharacterized SAM-binding protein YcdF (DUF218 family)